MTPDEDQPSGPRHGRRSRRSEKYGYAASSIWAMTIVVAWFVLAAVLGQSPLAEQKSAALVPYGVLPTGDFHWADVWKLLASQWLHVKFAHMLLNALVVAAAGIALERRIGAMQTLLIGLLGGTFGQFVACLFVPDAYASGASQAYLALCGALLVVAPMRTGGFWIGLVGAAIAVALDVGVSGVAGIKPGHLAGFAFGLTAGAFRRWGQRRPVE